MIIGPDISFYQDDPNTPKSVDFEKMKSAGAEFVILRAGQNSWIDSDFKDYWTRSKGILPRGSYWFYDSRSSPKSQADRWRGAIGDDLPEIGIWADFEERYGGAWGNEKFFREFMEHLKDLFPSSVEIGVYTAYYYWEARVKDRPYWHQFPLWVANYDVVKPQIPPPWTDWTFWQYTDRGDGKKYGAESFRIDLNYYNGDKAKMYQTFGIPYEPAPPNPLKTMVVSVIDSEGKLYSGEVVEEPA